MSLNEPILPHPPLILVKPKIPVYKGGLAKHKLQAAISTFFKRLCILKFGKLRHFNYR